MATFSNNLVAKNGKKMANVYYCEKCDYKCYKKYNWNKHILTAKHLVSTNCNTPSTESGKIHIKHHYTCEKCNKIYNDRTGLWRHNKKCNVSQVNEENNKTQMIKEVVDSSVFFEILKQNQDFKDLIVEQNKQLLEQNKQIIELSNNFSITNNNNNYNNNCHNKTFNLQFFLNEQCKDALNINEFIDSLKISFSDLENIGENGFANGISKIFVNGLKSLDIYKRPIHCSDLKRETMHVKEQTGWEKDNENNDRLKKAVKLIAHKNMLKINEWKNAYPQCKDSASKKNDQYLKMLICAAGPANKADEENDYNKIIRNVAKEVTIDKTL